MPAADSVPLGSQQASQHQRTGERELQMQPVETPHDREIDVRHRPRQIINAAAANPQNFRLLRDRQIVPAVDHRFSLSNPALVSVPSKKSFSSVSSPILLCSDFTSSAGAAGAMPPGPKTPEAPQCSASWAIVRSPLTVASATFALKAGVWFRCGRLFMVFPVHGDYRRFKAEIPLTICSNLRVRLFSS
jgi:hypothetical protein